MTFVEPVRRVDTMRYGKPSHHYVDGNGARIPGVTTILSGGMPKPALVGWGIRTVAEYAIDRWDELAAKPPSERLKELKGSPYADRDAAANRGTEVHALAEQLVQGIEVDVPDALAGHVESYVRWLDDYQPEPVLVERTCYHLGYGWAGTFDSILRFPDGRLLLCDIKTSNGVYGETAYQLAAYANSTHYLDDAGPQPMPEVAGCAVIHVRADGCDLFPVTVDDQVLLEMRYIARVALAADRCKTYIGEAAKPSDFGGQEAA